MDVQDRCGNSSIAGRVEHSLEGQSFEPSANAERCVEGQNGSEVMRQVEQLHTPTISADSRTASHFQKAQTHCLNSKKASSVSLQGAAALFSATAAAAGTHKSRVPL